MNSVNELQDIVRRSANIHICGSQTKSGFHPVDLEVTYVSTQSLHGIVTYDPQEFVVTMLAGTRVSEVVATLGKQGQYLPFDPLLVDSGATIGGTVACNASGPGRFRFGGIRDFLLGVRFVDGRGNCIRGGANVVKNAAGFDYPKLLVGSQGKLGLIYELTFKVFPRPESYATLISRFDRLDDALNCMNQLASSAMDIESLDLIPNKRNAIGYEIAIRIGGIATAIPNRLSRLHQFVPSCSILHDQEDEMYWRAASNFEWHSPGKSLLKLPIAPTSIPVLDCQLAKENVERRYSVGGNVVWIAMEWTTDWMSKFGAAQYYFGRPHGYSTPTGQGPFGQAIQRALDPDLKFV